MMEVNEPLGALKAAVSIYYNYTGQEGSCFDFDSMMMSARQHWMIRHGRYDLLSSTNTDTSGYKKIEIQRTLESSRSLVIDVKWTDTDRAWNYQTCTEVYQPMPTNGITDFEVPYVPNETAYFEHCQREWGVMPRPNWEEMYFMGQDISTGSNIFITNGQLDPWRAAGIQNVQGLPASIVIRTIEHAAHHLDLRSSHPKDPLSVTKVREEQRSHIRMWIKEWRDKYSCAGP